MRIALTGATGFLGSRLAKRLTERGFSVSCIVRETSETSELRKINAQVYSYKEFQNLYDIMKKISPELLIHVAGCFLSSHDDRSIENLLASNIHFPSVLMDAASKTGCKTLINTGTSWQWYRGAAFDPVNLYAASKQAFSDITEYYVNAEKWRKITLVLYDVYGDGDKRRKILNLLKEMKDGDSIDMSGGEQKLFLCFVEDAVDAYLRTIEIIDALPFGKEKQYHVRGEEAVSLKEITNIFLRISGKKAQINWGKRPYREREIMTPSNSGETVPGWKPKVSLEEGIKKFLI